MPRVYLETLIIGHKFCSILSILNELTLQKEFKKGNVNNVFWTKNKSTITTRQKSKQKILLEPGIEL